MLFNARSLFFYPGLIDCISMVNSTRPWVFCPRKVGGGAALKSQQGSFFSRWPSISVIWSSCHGSKPWFWQNKATVHLSLLQPGNAAAGQSVTNQEWTFGAHLMQFVQGAFHAFMGVNPTKRSWHCLASPTLISHTLPWDNPAGPAQPNRITAEFWFEKFRTESSFATSEHGSLLHLPVCGPR